MSLLTIPNNFVANTLIQSALVDADFTAVVTWSTTIDHSNTINSTGFYASDIKPLTAAEATFGATATGVGYKFLANDATATPLTVSGTSGQSAPIFNVTLTSGGAQVLYVDASGSLIFGSGSGFVSPATVGIANDSGAVNGLKFNIPSSSTNGFNFNIASSRVVQIDGVGRLFVTNAGSSLPTSATAGDIIAQRSSTTGIGYYGGSGSSGSIDWNLNTLGQISLFKPGVGFAAFSAGAYTNASDERIKGNIEDLPHGLDALRKFRAAQFTMNDEDTGARHFGFIAQQIQSILPELVTEAADGNLGIKQPHLLAVVAKAVQQLDIEVQALRAAASPQ